VTVDDCKRVIDTYLTKLFAVETSDIFCISAPNTVEVSFIPILTDSQDIAKSYMDLKFKVEVRDLDD